MAPEPQSNPEHAQPVYPAGRAPARVAAGLRLSGRAGRQFHSSRLTRHGDDGQFPLSVLALDELRRRSEKRGEGHQVIISKMRQGRCKRPSCRFDLSVRPFADLHADALLQGDATWGR